MTRLWMVVTTLLLFAWGCKEKEKPQGATIYYYPLHNVYFDKENNHFLQYDSLKNQWQKIKAADFKERNLGADTQITSPVDPVYKENQKHRIIYGTALYTNEQQLKEKYLEDSLGTVRPSKKVDIPEPDKPAEEPKRSKFRKWLDKVFKKEE